MRSLLRDHKSAESPPVGQRDAPADAASRINGGLGLPGLAGHGASWVSRPFVVLACSYAVLVALGWLRIATGAEFEFASLGLLLVVAVSWVSGRTAELLCGGCRHRGLAGRRHRGGAALQRVVDSLGECHGAYNRRAFFQVGSHALGMAQRRKSGIALAFNDLDNFKQLNDTAGHALGDAALAFVDPMPAAGLGTSSPAEASQRGTSPIRRSRA